MQIDDNLISYLIERKSLKNSHYPKVRSVPKDSCRIYPKASKTVNPLINVAVGLTNPFI